MPLLQLVLHPLLLSNGDSGLRTTGIIKITGTSATACKTADQAVAVSLGVGMTTFNMHKRVFQLNAMAMEVAMWIYAHAAEVIRSY